MTFWTVSTCPEGAMLEIWLKSVKLGLSYAVRGVTPVVGSGLGPLTSILSRQSNRD